MKLFTHVQGGNHERTIVRKQAARRTAQRGGNVGAVQASLRPDPQLEVISLAQPATVQELAALAPDVILFDAGAAYPEPAFALLRTCPGLLLVGVNPDCNRAVLWAGQQLCELSTSDLVEVIRRQSQKKRREDTVQYFSCRQKQETAPI